MEQWPTNKIPDEVKITEEKEFQVNTDGKKYRYEKGGVYYGGDYLDELPEEIDLTLPLPPKEENSVI